MFGMIHQSFFDSSINDTDPVTRLVFVAMIVLSDLRGRIDMTPAALARRINVDRDAVIRAIEILGQPDPDSRSPEYEGRRIVPIAPDRSWGWIVVNKDQYRYVDADPDYVRAQTRERVRRHRAKKEKNQKKRTNSDTDTDTEETVSNARNAGVTDKTLRAWFEIAWEAYPRKDGRRAAFNSYRATVHTTGDKNELLAHLANYKAQLIADGTAPKYIKKGSTWFHNWSDEVYASPVRSGIADQSAAPHPSAPNLPGFTV